MPSRRKPLNADPLGGTGKRTMELIFLPLRLFMAHPWLALAPAFLFALCFARHRAGFPTARSKLSILGPAFIWFGYAPYEWFTLQWSKGVVAPIRIDLLVLGPVLYAAVFLGVWSCMRASRQARAAQHLSGPRLSIGRDVP